MLERSVFKLKMKDLNVTFSSFFRRKIVLKFGIGRKSNRLYCSKRNKNISLSFVNIENF